MLWKVDSEHLVFIRANKHFLANKTFTWYNVYINMIVTTNIAILTSSDLFNIRDILRFCVIYVNYIQYFIAKFTYFIVH